MRTTIQGMLLGWLVLLVGAGSARADLNQQVLNYALARLNGPAVGNGECWTLADWALAYAGAHRPGRDGYDTYVYGWAVGFNQVQPGDIVQIERLQLVFRDGSSQYWPHHTAIVSAVSGNQVQIIQQNAGNTLAERRRVTQTWLDLSAWQSGQVTFFRPQPR